MFKDAWFYELPLGQRFYFDNVKYMKIQLYDNYEVAVNLETFKVRYFNSSERGVTVWEPPDLGAECSDEAK